MIKKFHQLFEANNNDEINSILNIISDEGIDMIVDESEFDDFHNMSETLGYDPERIGSISIPYRNHPKHIEIVSNAVQRLEQIEDVTMIKRVNGIWDFLLI